MPKIKLLKACFVNGTAYNPGDEAEISDSEMPYFTGAVGLANAVEVVSESNEEPQHTEEPAQ